MSLANIKPYFRDRMAAVGYENEHTEAFNLENIPSTLRDEAFHILVGAATGQSNNQNHLVMTVEVELQMFFKGYRSEEDGRLRAEIAMENILKETLTAKNRVTQASTGIKNVEVDTAAIAPLDESRDNVSAMAILFSVTYMLDFG
jgi:hypothetical protein